MSTQDNAKKKAPSKKRKTSNPPINEPNPIHDKVSFRSNASPRAIQLFDEYFNTRNPHLERGIKFEKCSPEIKEIITYHKWNKLARPRKTKVNFTMVAEFYSILAEKKLKDVKTVKVRSVDVPFSPTIINAYFGTPEIPSDTLYDKKWELELESKLEAKAFEAKRFLSRRGTWKEKRFQFGSASKDVKVMKHFVNYDIDSNSHICAFTYEEACLVYAIMHKEPVDVGQIIFKKAHEFAHSRRSDGVLPFPSFVSSLCRRNKVPSIENDRIINPSRVLIGAHNFEPNAKSTNESPPSQDTIPVNQNEPFLPPHRNLAYEARFDRLDSEVANMRGEIAALSSNMLKGFEQFGKICNDLRTGIRGHREFNALALKENALDEGFDDCQEEPYVVGPWEPAIPIYSAHPGPSRPPPLTSGGASGSTFAGTGSAPDIGVTSTTRVCDDGVHGPITTTTATQSSGI